MAQHGVRLIIGKGGLRADSAAAFAELGGAYLAVSGADTAAILSSRPLSGRTTRA